MKLSSLQIAAYQSDDIGNIVSREYSWGNIALAEIIALAVFYIFARSVTVYMPGITFWYE